MRTLPGFETLPGFGKLPGCRTLLGCALVAAALSLGAPDAAHAQSRADSAAVLLEAAEQLRLRGEADGARALLSLIADRYAGTPAAGLVSLRLAALAGAPAGERSGRTELLVWGASYGASLGVALPYVADAGSSEAYGLGLLLGAPAGFLAARRYASATDPSRGQARALTFGSSWGAFQGFGWAEVFELAGAETSCPAPGTGGPCYYEDGNEERARIGSAVVGSLAGVGVGALLARKPITEGTAAAVSLSALWGTWFGFASSYIAGADGDTPLAAALTGGNAGLVTAALLAPGWNLTESRARLISVGGVIGGLGGAGLLLIVKPEDDRVAVAVPLIGSIAGLAVAAGATRPDGVTDGPAQDPPGTDALLHRDGAGWSLSTPTATVRWERGSSGLEPAVHVPLVRVRF